MIAPLLLVPYVWHDRFVSTKPILWQLREGEVTRFAWQYLAGNLEGARNFFFSIAPAQPNSLWLALVGLAAIGWAAVRLWQRWRSRELRRAAGTAEMPIMALFALTIAANLGMLMFYYWSRLDEPIASRFALPACFVLALGGGWFAHSVGRHWRHATFVIGGGLAAWVLVLGAPAYAHQYYTSQNLVMHELNWELEQVTARPRPVERSIWVSRTVTISPRSSRAMSVTGLRGGGVDCAKFTLQPLKSAPAASASTHPI